MASQRAVALAVTAIVLGIGIAACGSSSGDGEGDGASKVGIVMKSFQNPEWHAVANGAEAEAERLGVESTTQAGKTEADVQGQISQVENMLAQGVDALVIAPNGTGQLAPVLNRAQEEGVEVVLVDTEVPGVEPTSFLQTDNKGMSEKISAEFIDHIGGSAEAGILNYPQISAVERRVEGTENAVKGTGVKIVSELAGNCLRSKGLNASTDMLQAHPGVTAIFAECSGNSGGAVQAIEAAGKTPGKDIQVIGFDGVPEELQLIQEGKLFATVWQDFPAIGEEATKVAVGAAEGKKFPAEILVPGVIITAQNAGEFKAQGETVVRK